MDSKTTGMPIVQEAETFTFFEQPHGLSVREDTLDIDPYGPLGRVLSSNHGEAEAFHSWTLLKSNILDAVALTLFLTRHCTEFGAFQNLDKMVAIIIFLSLGSHWYLLLGGYDQLRTILLVTAVMVASPPATKLPEFLLLSGQRLGALLDPGGAGLVLGDGGQLPPLLGWRGPGGQGRRSVKSLGQADHCGLGDVGPQLAVAFGQGGAVVPGSRLLPVVTVLLVDGGWPGPPAVHLCVGGVPTVRGQH